MNREFSGFELKNIKLPEGISLENPLFILSPEPCCSFTALPFWARLSGKIVNTMHNETILKINLQLMDENGLILSTLSQKLIIDGKGESPFEIKIQDFEERFRFYQIEIEEISEDELLRI